MIQIKNLSIGYKQERKNLVLSENINFDLSSGEILSIMGPNGCGKSTFLKTLSGLLSPLGGHIIIKGKTLKNYTPKELSQKMSLVLTQRPPLQNFTVKEVISLGRYPYTSFWGTLKKEDHHIIEQTISLLELGTLANKTFEELSDGQKQKVFIARSVVQDTPLILLDEPTSFLDIPRKNEFFNLLLKLSKEKKKTIIFSSHDWDLSLKYSHSLLFFGKGKKVIKATPEDFLLSREHYNLLNEEKFLTKNANTKDPLIQEHMLKIEDPQENQLVSQALHKRGHFIFKNGVEIIKEKNKEFVLSYKHTVLERTPTLSNLFEKLEEYKLFIS